MLIGNLTRDPELRYTPAGTAVCTIGLATNRSWTTEAGEKKEETEFHRIVAWNKLAELCSQLLVKGRKIYIEGRLQTRSWQGQDGNQRQTTEVVIDDMIILDPRRVVEELRPVQNIQPEEVAAVSPSVSQNDTGVSQAPPLVTKVKKQKEPDVVKEVPSEDINPDDIPF